METTEISIKRDAYFYKAKIIDYFMQYYSLKLIANEVPYGSLRKMCDLVMVRGNSTFGIEVKSDKDSPERLPGQLQELTKVFDYVIAFVTPHLAARITEQIPPECGLFTLENDKIKILQRPSKLDLDPVEIAYSIPSVYIKVRFNIPSELNVDELRKYTAQRYPRKLKEVYRDYLSKKYLTRFNLFKSERRHTTLVDDVTTLSIGEIIY